MIVDLYSGELVPASADSNNDNEARGIDMSNIPPQKIPGSPYKIKTSE